MVYFVKNIRIKKIQFLFFLTLFFHCCLPLKAYNFIVDDIAYTIVSYSDKTVEVATLGYAPGFVPGPGMYVGDIEIPSYVEYENKKYTVVAIGNYCFDQSIYLNSVVLPETLTSIGEGAFGYSGLKNITIPNSVTYMGREAFASCYLSEIKIPGSVTYIGELAFSYCRDLTKVEIPESVTYIGEGAFANCDNLISLEVNKDNDFYSSEDGLLFNKDKTRLIQCPGSKVNVTVPESVEFINGYAFSNCQQLKEIKIPNSVIEIGKSAFSDCYSLENIILPESLITIKDNAFQWCKSLESISIPSTVKSIGNYVFSDCRSLKNIELPESLATIGGGAFSYCLALETITLPESLTNIEGYCFSNCSALTNVKLPDSLVSIGDGAFSDCNALESIDIPNFITSISPHTFDGCISLTNVNLPEDLTTIGQYAFYGCTSLENISLLGHVDTLLEQSFGNCPALSTVVCYAERVPVIEGLFGDRIAFGNISQNAVLYVYEDVLEIYKNSLWAKYFIEILPIKDESGSVSDVLDSKEQNFTVYDLRGACVLSTRNREELNNLKKGLYIINGKKTLIK